MLKVRFRPEAPGGGSYTSESIWDTVSVFSKSRSPGERSPASCSRACVSTSFIKRVFTRSRSASLAWTDGNSRPPVVGSGFVTDSDKPSLPSMALIVSTSRLPAAPPSTASTGTSSVSPTPAGTSPARVVAKRVPSPPSTTVPAGIVTDCWVRFRNSTIPRAFDCGTTVEPVTLTVLVPSTMTRFSPAGILPVMKTDSIEGLALTGRTRLCFLDSGVRVIWARGINSATRASTASTPTRKASTRTPG